ncbi:hypothetical protein EAH79_09280 [Sphingomonas koreensis]|nr:hypothetical protein EAH79_09280 [Sphingomonas koreensis]
MSDRMPACRYTMGAEAQPLCVFEEFATDPEKLRYVAAASVFEPGRHHYPGIRAAVPPDYLASRLPEIGEAITQAFGLTGEIAVIDASFSIVTRAPQHLTLPQRLPHCDAFAPNRIALIHYLSLDDGDGTAFFRHRSTGFETVCEERRSIYFGQLEAELRRGAQPEPAYIAGDTGLFERIWLAEARFNRALLYQSWNLHSGAIAPSAALSPDPAKGRLTVTAFLSVG